MHYHMNQEIKRDDFLYGYTRLSFGIRAWIILLLILVVSIAAFLLLPRHKTLIYLYKERGMLDKALFIIHEVLKEDPNNSELLGIAAEIYQLKGEPEAAIIELERALLIDPRNIKLLLKLAAYYEWNRKPKKAVKIWEKISSIDPYNVKALRRLIRYYRYYGFQEQEAKTIVKFILLEKRRSSKKCLLEISNKTLLKKTLSDPIFKVLTYELRCIVKEGMDHGFDIYLNEILRWLYRLRLQRIKEFQEKRKAFVFGKDDLIVRALEVFVITGKIKLGEKFATYLDKIWNQGVKNRMTLVKIMRWNGTEDEAISLLSKLTNEDPNNPDILLSLSAIAEAKNDLTTAIDAYKRLLLLVPDSKEYKLKLADLYLQANQPMSAYLIIKKITLLSNGKEEDLKRLLEISGATGNKFIINDSLSIALSLKPNDVFVLRRASEMYLWIDRPEKAYLAYKQLVFLSNKDEKMVHRLIQLAKMTGKKEILKDAANTALRLYPNDPQILYRSAHILIESGEIIKAISVMSNYTKMKPQDEEAKRFLSKLYLWENRSDLGAELKAELSDRDPYDFKKAIDAGSSFIEAGKLKKGIIYLERALRLRPDSIGLRRRLIRYYSWLGYDQKRLEHLEFLLKKGVINERERIELARLYFDRKEDKEVLECLKPMESHIPLAPEVGIMLAEAYVLLGMNNQAISLYKRLAKENPSDAKVLAGLGDRALWLKRTDIALKFYNAALKKDPKNLKALKGSAQIYAWNNDPDRAIERLEAYNRLNPNDYEVRYQLGELYFANQREGEAFSEFKKALRLIKAYEKSIYISNKHGY